MRGKFVALIYARRGREGSPYQGTLPRDQTTIAFGAGGGLIAYTSCTAFFPLLQTI